MIIKQIAKELYRRAATAKRLLWKYLSERSVHMSKMWHLSLPPSIFISREKEGCLWFVSPLACRKRSQESRLCAQICIHAGSLFGLRFFGPHCLPEYQSAGLTGSSVDVCATHFFFTMPCSPARPRTHGCAIVDNAPCLSFLFPPVWWHGVRRPSLFLPRESSAGSFSLRGNSCRSSAVIRCQTWMWRQGHRRSISATSSDEIYTRNPHCDCT